MGASKRGPLTGITAFLSNPGGLIPRKLDIGGKVNTFLTAKIDRGLGHIPPPDPPPPPGPSAASITLAEDEEKRRSLLANTVPPTQKGTTLLSASTRLGS